MLFEDSSVKGSPEDKQPSGPCIKGSAKISRRVTLAHYTGQCEQTIREQETVSHKSHSQLQYSFQREKDIK